MLFLFLMKFLLAILALPILVISDKCTMADCCVASPDCGPGELCLEVCNINTNCEGNIFDICPQQGPTVEITAAANSFADITIPPKPTATETLNSTSTTAATSAVATKSRTVKSRMHHPKMTVSSPLVTILK